MAQATMVFPPDFIWGTATSAFQNEGNNSASDWWQWEREPGRILHGDRSGLACDWWQNAEADLDLAASLGTNGMRISLEWSRIEPEPGAFSDEVLTRYREIIMAMRQRGLQPMVALHHFSNPVWLVEKGDFSKALVVDYFRRYAAKCAAALGDLVSHWITINEPLVYVVMRYLLEAFPAPSERGWSAALNAVRQLLRCHAAAYWAIKELFPRTQVGVAKHFRPLQPARPGNPADRLWARLASRFFNDLWIEAMANGRLRFPIGGGSVDHLAGSFDFIGVNYYSRSFVRFPPVRGGLFENSRDPSAQMSDDNFFEIYPQGLLAVIKWLVKYGKPIYITESGVPDRADRLRPGYMLTHLRQVWLAINFNYPVMGYYHWTLVDNFEWERGWSQRFGLVELQPETQRRVARPSAALYSEICRSNSIHSGMAERYAPELMEEMFPGRSP